MMPPLHHQRLYTERFWVYRGPVTIFQIPLSPLIGGNAQYKRLCLSPLPVLPPSPRDRHALYSPVPRSQDGPRTHAEASGEETDHPPRAPDRPLSAKTPLPVYTRHRSSKNHLRRDTGPTSRRRCLSPPRNIPRYLLPYQDPEPRAPQTHPRSP